MRTITHPSPYQMSVAFRVSRDVAREMLASGSSFDRNVLGEMVRYDAATDTLTDRTPDRETGVPTPDLRVGDIVWAYGMRIELRTRSDYEGGSVTRFDGYVLNADEVPNSVVPVAWRTSSEHPEYPRGTYWAIQGNARALWSREVPAASDSVLVGLTSIDDE